MKLKSIQEFLKKLTEGFTFTKVVIIILGAAIATFGIHNIHQQTGITEGGVIGFMLLSNHWLGISPSLLTTVLDVTCYVLAFRYLGGGFIRLSVFSTLTVSGFFKIWEMFPPMLPNLTNNPLIAAICGGLFVGIGVGLVVRQGGSSGGDDALALTISHLTKWRISRAYLLTDLTVLFLSLTYIPLSRIAFSLVTVTVSSLIIDYVQNYKFGKSAVRSVASIKNLQEEV